MIRLSPRAERDLDALLAYYEERDRPEASASLLAAIEQAAQRIERDPGAGLPAPRSYPALARPGQAWVKAGPYWVRYSTAAQVITGVFYEPADSPARRPGLTWR